MVQLQLPSYEGPLELLLQLIETRRLDISELALAAVADQYMEQVAALPAAADAAAGAERTEALASFIDIGGRLILLKARQLLPPPDQAQSEEEAEEASDLVSLVREYQRHRDGIATLEGRQSAAARSYPIGAPPPVERPALVGLPDAVTLELIVDLARTALNRATAREAEERERRRQAETAALERQRVTLRARAADLRLRLEDADTASFRDWIAAARSRLEVIVSFMAMLELCKSRAISVRQSADWGDIEIRRLDDAPDTAWAVMDAPDGVIALPSQTQDEGAGRW